jgi:hypothetical protein
MYYETEEEKEIFIKVCDLAVRAGGLQAMSAVQKLLNELKLKK